MTSASYSNHNPALVSSRKLAVLEHHRVPYDVEEQAQVGRLEQLLSTRTGHSLLWPAAGTNGGPRAGQVTTADGMPIPIFAGVVPDSAVPKLLPQGDWHRLWAVIDSRGQELGSIWGRDEGSIFVPFDPDEVIINFWSERYAAVSNGAASRSLKRGAMRTYYHVRPLMPRTTQIWLRRRVAQAVRLPTFPQWPTETAVNNFFDFLFALVSRIADAPIPRIAPWPGGHSWALVLTHDVERQVGYARIDDVLDIERSRGLRSSWYFVPRRYRVETSDLLHLQDVGNEVGVHGLYHDGRDLSSLSLLRKRLPAMREAADSWGAVGFRAPAMHRRWEWMPLLGFDYDTSFPDTDPYEPMPGGCCSWLPFFIDDLVELPVTLPQDHTLFVILGHRDAALWVEKAGTLRASGSMALIDTHPDYLVDRVIRSAYTAFLDRVGTDSSAWRALPREVAEWWRRRAASSLTWTGTEWRIAGAAAADGRVEFVEALA